MIDLDRFTSAQEYVYDEVLAEIKKGRKETHWMWFMFPQICGLGVSKISYYYSLNSESDAIMYLNHEVLGPRLIEMVYALLALEESNPEVIFGDIDALKLKSSMTLFYMASNNPIFLQVLEKYYEGELDQKTVEILESQKNPGTKKKLSLLDRLKNIC